MSLVMVTFAVSELLETEAEKLNVSPTNTVAAEGVALTMMEGGGDDCVPEPAPPPPQPRI